MNKKNIKLIAMLIIPSILSCTTEPIQNNIDINNVDNTFQSIKPNSSLPTRIQTPRPILSSQPISNNTPIPVQSNNVSINNPIIENKAEVIVSSITVKPASLSLKVGQVVEFQAVVNMSDGSTNQNTRINSLNTNIVELQQGFKILGKSEGQTKIEVTDIFDTSKKATIDIIVVKADEPLPPPKIVVESINLSEQNLSLTVGEKKKITATVKLTDNSTTNQVNWSSSDSSILTINSDGDILAVKEGLAIVTANSQTEVDKKVSIPVAVNKPIVNPTSLPIPTPSSTIQPTVASSPTPTQTSTPTPIPTATSTTLPTPTPIVTPTPKIISINKIAFSANNEIYTMNPDGSEQFRLTDNVAVDGNPNWSYDNNKIVFFSDYEIYTMNPDGSNKIRLTNNSNIDVSPSWSPDGKKIVFRSDRDGTKNTEIYIMSYDGSNQIRLTNNTYQDDAPSFSPDGSKIIFSSDRPAGSRDVYIMNVDGSNQIKLTNTILQSQGNNYYPSFSPDGKKIAFTSTKDGNNEIYIMNADGSNPINLTNNLSQDYRPSWSPDGKKIIFESTRDGNYEIYIMNSDGSNQTRITNNTINDCCVSWSK